MRDLNIKDPCVQLTVMCSHLFDEYSIFNEKQFVQTLARVVGGWKKRESENEQNLSQLQEEKKRCQALSSQQQQVLKRGGVWFNWFNPS